MSRLITGRILLTLDRKCAGAHPSQRWQFVRDERGVYVREVTDVNRLTPEEYDLWVEAVSDTPQWLVDREEAEADPGPRWPLLGLALRWVRLLDEEVTVAAEMAAYGAPSECAAQAYKSIEQRRELLLLQAIN